MHDPVTDRDRRDAKFVPQPVAGNGHRRRNIRHSLDRISPIGHRIAARATCPQTRSAADTVHLSLDLTTKRTVAFDRVDLKLHTGRAGIDDEDRIHGDHAATVGAF